MDLKDATLMFLSESAAHPAVASIARSAYDRLVDGEEIGRRAPIRSQRPPVAPEDEDTQDEPGEA
jgi:hypothetical protein